MPRYEELKLPLIDEGRFMDQADQDLAELQRSLLGFARRHGQYASGAKAKLTIEITLACEDPDQSLFSIKAQTKLAHPTRPASTSMALAAESEDGDGECLFVKPSGSNAQTPRQQQLTTDDGRPIDPATGEIKTPA